MNIIKYIRNILLCLYIIPAILFVPYFNYKFTKEHGFVKWLLLGGIVATGKGIAWPFFLYHDLTSESNNNQEQIIGKTEQLFLKDKELCKKCIMSLLKVHEMMSDHKGNIIQLTLGEENKIKNIIKKSLIDSQYISDDFLDSIHEDFRKIFRGNLIKGWELYLYGLESHDPAKQLSGINLIEEWYSFNNNNSDLIYFSIIKD